MHYEYTPHGVCSTRIVLDIDNDRITDMHFVGGCSGNTQGISALVTGMRVEDVIARLRGVRCGRRETSCPDQLARALGHDRKIIRAMPNTPALVNAGMTSVTPNALVTPEDTADVLNIFRCFGEAEVIAEPMIHPVVGVSGSAPAYVFMFIEAMADAAVLGGMPRAQAYKFAAQAVMGSAKMVLETGKHPGELKDMVCSPGGTTIEAVRVLEDRGLRSAVIEAMEKCMEKSEKLSKS